MLCYQKENDLILNEVSEELVLDIKMMNDESHFGEDEKFLFGYCVLLSVWIYMMAKFAMSTGKILFSSNDWTKIIVFLSLIVIGVAYFYRLIHFILYNSNGKGMHFF